jgi:hypothetical protein
MGRFQWLPAHALKLTGAGFPELSSALQIGHGTKGLQVARLKVATADDGWLDTRVRSESEDALSEVGVVTCARDDEVNCRCIFFLLILGIGEP